MGYWHGDAARYLKAQLVAVVDPDARKGNPLAQAMRVGTVAKDLSEILEQGIHAVHICSPLSTHFALTRQAAEAGLHALVEKPLAESAEEASVLLDIAQRNSTVLCPTHQMAFQDCMQAVAKAMDGLEEIAAIDIRICSAGGIGRTERELDALIADILPHPLSIIRKLWPDASWKPHLWTVNHPRPGELRVNGEHAGTLFSILLSMHARPTCFDATVYGHRGAITLDFFHGFAVRHDGRASRLRKIARPFESAIRVFSTASINLLGRGLRGELAYPGLRNLVRSFYAAAQGEAPTPIPREDIVAIAVARDIISQRAMDQTCHGSERAGQDW
jgi:predicted dehydrogenase